MSIEDILKITAAATSAPLTALLIKYVSDRRAEKEAQRQEQIKGDSTIQIAALGSYKEIIEAYQKHEESLIAENRALRDEISKLRQEKQIRRKP